MHLGLRAGVIAIALLTLPPAASAAAAPPPFERVELERIALPDSITDASQPAYTQDGKHLLFWANNTEGGAALWIVGEDGSDPRNLTEGVENAPVTNASETEQPGLIFPLSDRKRVFFGPYGDPRMLECSPSVVDCQTKQILDIDLGGAREPRTIPPRGMTPFPTPILDIGARPQISPDGNWVMFSDIWLDVIEVMVIAKVTRGENGYTTSEPRVLNPAGPASPSETDVRPWSDASALFESKSFVDGGRAVTYVQVGGEAGGNPDLWKVDLQTGERTRLTAHPDWDEDHGWSPDGKTNAFTIDSRGSHYLDFLSLMPYRSFFDAWEIAAVAIPAVGGAARRVCAPFATRLLTTAGDDGGRLMGQQVQPYDGGDIRPSGNYQGSAMWKPDGTALALSTQSFTTLAGAPYLEIARFPTRRPTKPLPIVSSEPGDWAPRPENYNAMLGATTNVTLSGLHSGTVTLSYAQAYAAVNNTATYDDYSDDGKSFVNGTDTVERSGSSVFGGTTRVTSNLTLSGEHTGSLDRDITYSNVAGGQGGTAGIDGRSKVTFDGMSHEGVETPEERCESVRDKLPRAVKLKAKVKRASKRKIKVKVTAAYKGAGLNEMAVDRRPVRGAKVKYAGRRATTNKKGVATLRRRKGKRANKKIRVSAGDSFKPTRLRARRR